MAEITEIINRNSLCKMKGYLVAFSFVSTSKKKKNFDFKVNVAF